MSFVSKSNYNLSSNLPPSLVITTTVELGPAPLGLITCMETRYWVQVLNPGITCLHRRHQRWQEHFAKVFTIFRGAFSMLKVSTACQYNFMEKNPKFSLTDRLKASISFSNYCKCENAVRHFQQGEQRSSQQRPSWNIVKTF